MLVLNLLPCEEEITVSETDCEVLCLENDQQESIPGDFCSPFCICHCCHIFSIDTTFAELAEYSPEISTTLFLHFNDTGEEVVFSHFQPPRV